MTQLRSYIERVLRLKEDQDAIAGDIREVYAEAKSNGFDKTVMGRLVAFLRKRDKDPHGVEETDAIFDIYLTEYDRGTQFATRAHAHEAQPAHDPSTGELTEVPATRPVSATAPVAGGEPAKGDAGETTRLGIALNEPCTDASPTTSQIPQGVASETEAAIEPQASVSQINPESATPSPVAVEPVSAAAPTSDPGSSFPDDLEVPLFLRREKAA